MGKLKHKILPRTSLGSQCVPLNHTQFMSLTSGTILALSDSGSEVEISLPCKQTPQCSVIKNSLSCGADHSMEHQREEYCTIHTLVRHVRCSFPEIYSMVRPCSEWRWDHMWSKPGNQGATSWLIFDEVALSHPPAKGLLTLHPLVFLLCTSTGTVLWIM